MCPVCTVGIAAGVGFSRWLGVSDTISGLWIGAAIFAFSWLTAKWIEKKTQKENKFALFFGLSFAAWWLLTVLPLKFVDIISPLAPKVLGINNMLFGIILGVMVAFVAAFLEQFLRKKNQGKALFPYQKVILPISILLLISTIIYFIKI